VVLLLGVLERGVGEVWGEGEGLWGMLVGKRSSGE
jgi:hypothetical protein